LTETLKTFTGDLTDAQLKSMGYNQTQIMQIQAMAKNANDAATKVKTMSQLIDTLKEAVGSGWSTTWQTVFGDFDQAKTLFTSVNNVIGKFINTSSNARNQVLKDWADLGGRTAIINSIANAFHALIAVLTPIKNAFREIFPATTGYELAQLSKRIEEFTKHLKIGGETADKIKRTFAGVFAVFKIGIDVVKEIVGVVFRLFSSMSSGSGKILDTTANIGDLIVRFKDFLEAGDRMHKFFLGLSTDLLAPIKAIKTFAGWIVDAWHGVDRLAKPAAENLHKSLVPLGELGDRLLSIWHGIQNVFKAVVNAVTPAAKAIGKFFKTLVDNIKSSFGNIDYTHVFDGLNTGLIAAIALILHKILSGGIELDFTGGFLDKIKTAFGGLTDTLKAMQLSLKAKALIEIAIAIGILTVSVIALSLVDSQKLTTAVGALTVMFANLLGSMAVFEEITKSKGFKKMPLVALSLIGLSIALDILASAVVKMSGLSWDEIAKGLTGLTVVMAAMIDTVRFLPKEKMISTGIGMVILGEALKVMASAMKDFAEISWADMAKGIAGIALVLGALAVMSKVVSKSKGGLFEDLQFVLLAASVKILASAMAGFSNLSWSQIARGLVAMAGAMAIMVDTIDALPPTSVLAGAALLITALGLGKIADAMAKLGNLSWGAIGKSLTELLGVMTILTLALDLIDPLAPLAAAALLITALALDKVGVVLDHFATMSWGDIGKALTVLAGALTILTVALDLMLPALPGAAAMVVVAGALAVLVPILILLGKMSWGEIGKGLLALAGVFAVLGVSGLLLAPVVPLIFALGASVALLGGGMALAGAGVLFFALAIAELAKAGSAGTKALVEMVTNLSGLIPLIMTDLANGIVAFAGVIEKGAPAFVGAITAVLGSFMDAIIKLTPKIGAVFQVLLTTLLDLLVKNQPKIVDAGFKLLIGFLDGIANNIHKVVDTATSIIVNFLNAISDNLPRIIDSGLKLIVAFVNGLANGIRNNTAAMHAAGLNLASAIIDGMTGGLFSGVGKVVDAAKSVAKSALNAAENLLGINSPSKEFFDVGKFSSLGIAKGLIALIPTVIAASKRVASSALDALKDSMTNVGASLGGDVNLSPVITPVLDLSGVQKSASQLGGMLAVAPISVTSTTTNANNAANGFQNKNDNLSGDNFDPSNLAPAAISYTQINNSPKALSSADIYRQTRNQLSSTKEVLP
jgi:hypothetical protein